MEDTINWASPMRYSKLTEQNFFIILFFLFTWQRWELSSSLSKPRFVIVCTEADPTLQAFAFFSRSAQWLMLKWVPGSYCEIVLGRFISAVSAPTWFVLTCVRPPLFTQLNGYLLLLPWERMRNGQQCTCMQRTCVLVQQKQMQQLQHE